MYKKIIYILSIMFYLTSCGTFDSVKRGLSGAKQDSVDEFLIKKKDPLIMPPDYKNLPTPGEKALAQEEIKVFKNILENSSEEEIGTSTSTESSILKKIKSK